MSLWTGRGAATRVYSPDWDADFQGLPQNVQRLIETKLDEMGMRISDFPHHRLTASTGYRLRVGDYRIIYEFDAEKNVIHLLAVGKRDKIYKRR